MLTTHQVNLVAVRAYRSPRTIYRLLAGEKVSSLAEAAIRGAASELGFTLPPKRPAQSDV